MITKDVTARLTQAYLVDQFKIGQDKYYQEPIQLAYRGLNEISRSLEPFMPYLNLKDKLIFAAETWKERFASVPSFVKRHGIDTQNLDSNDVYKVFSSILRAGYDNDKTSLTYFAKKLPGREKQYEELNPFDKSDLEERLNEVSKEDFKDLLASLLYDVKKYYFEIDYKKLHPKDSDDVCMNFQSVYPNPKTNVPNYCKQVVMLLGGPVQTYKIRDEVLDAEAKKRQEVKQQELNLEEEKKKEAQKKIDAERELMSKIASAKPLNLFDIM